jgi:predicted RNase H-like nuclease
MVGRVEGLDRLQVKAEHRNANAKIEELEAEVLRCAEEWWMNKRASIAHAKSGDLWLVWRKSEDKLDAAVAAYVAERGA